MLSFTPARGQEPLSARIVDEFGEVCSEDLMARLDHFLVEVFNNNPGSRGLVIFYGRLDTEGRNAELPAYITSYASGRGIKEPLNVGRGELRAEQKIQFWLVPSGAADPEPINKYVAPTAGEATLFDRAWIGFDNGSGKWELYSDNFLDLGCGFSPNRDLFSKRLKEDPGLNGFLIVYTKGPSKKRGLHLAARAIIDLIAKHGVRRSRIKAIYGGPRKEAEVEFWLVPKGQPLPKARPGLDPVNNL